MWRSLLGLASNGKPGVQRKVGKNRQRMARRIFFESLERREVLTAVVVGGTSAGDTITIDDSGSDLVVTLNGIPTTYTGPIDSVTINAGDGADVINIDGVPTSSGGSSTVTEAEPNDSIATAQDLEAAGWVSGNDDPNLDDGLGNPIGDPHVKVNATYDGSLDYYRFVLTQQSLVRVDIDLVNSSAEFDSYVQIVDASDNVVIDLNFVPAENDDIVNDAGSTSGTDSYVVADLPANLPGEAYYIKVARSPLTAFISGTTYQMHVSASGHGIATGGTPPVIVNGEGGSDTLNIAASLTPGELHLGPDAFSGSFGSGEISYTSVESVGGTGPYKLAIDLMALGLQDGNADTTFIRPDGSGTQLLVDINGVPFFAGAIASIDDPLQNQDITVTGSDDDDTITIANTLLSAVVYGQGGNDGISTAGGNDYVSGGAGNDTISGGSGQDRLYGNDGNDVLMGNGGNDVLSGGDGIDLLTGGAGRDVIIGGLGADIAFGNGDRDLFFASGATNGNVGINGDSQSVLDANDAAMLQLLFDWGVSLTNSFASTGNDGAIDLMLGGAGDDDVVGDGSFIFLE